MIARSPLAVLAILPLVAAFQAPENPQANVKLPNIRKSGPQKAAPVATRRKINDSAAVEDGIGQKVSVAKLGRASQRKNRRIIDDGAKELEYWNDDRIHTLGNIGFFGAIHAVLAPFSTKIIDIVAYNGTDIRFLVAEALSKKVKSSKIRVADLCCGVGFSTRALRKAFPDAETVIGMDTSREMISVAKFVSNHLGFLRPIVKAFSRRASSACAGAATTFQRGNAECTGLTGESFDLVTIMYAFHEAPRAGRERILQEAYRLLQPGGMVAVLDITTDYTPSSSMLAGEPYVLEYQKNIHSQIRSMRGFDRVSYTTVVPNHVGMWILRRGNGLWS